MRVVFPVNSGVFEPEIGAQVNHLAALLQERNGKFRGNAMRQGEKNDLRLPCNQRRVRFGEAQDPGLGMMGKFGKHLRQRLAGVLTRSDGG